MPSKPKPSKSCTSITERKTGADAIPPAGAEIVFSCRRPLEGTYPKRVRRPSAQECQRMWIPAYRGMTVDAYAGMTLDACAGMTMSCAGTASWSRQITNHIPTLLAQSQFHSAGPGAWSIPRFSGAATSGSHLLGVPRVATRQWGYESPQPRVAVPLTTSHSALLPTRVKTASKGRSILAWLPRAGRVMTLWQSNSRVVS
jgi:hypothetical protein